MLAQLFIMIRSDPLRGETGETYMTLNNQAAAEILILAILKV